MAADTGNDQIYDLAVSSDVNASTKSIAAFTAAVSTCSINTSELSSSLVLIKSNFLSLTGSTGSLMTYMANLSSGFTGLGSDFTSISVRTDKLSSNISGLGTDFTALKTDFTSVTSNVNKLSPGLTGLSAKFNKLSGNMKGASVDEASYTKADKKIKSVSKSTDDMNKKLKSTGSIFKKAESALSKFLKSALSMGNIKKGMDFVDQYINAGNELNRIKDGTQSLQVLQDKVNAAATRSSISYKDMASAVSDIGRLDTFKDDDQAVAFAELMQKTLKVEGSSQSLSDISKAMSDNTIKGDEYSSLTQGAPMIGDALSSFTGKSGDELKKMADQGLITADLLKRAMFAASGDIESKFAKQPKTFAEIWIQIKNTAVSALSPLMELVSNIINSDSFQGALAVISSALGLISQAATSLINFIMNNGDIILSLLIALGAVLLGVLAVSIVSWFIMYLPILLIIGAIMILIHIITQVGGSFQDIFSFIGGVIGAFVATLYNAFAFIWNIVAAFVNFFANVFSDPVASAKVLFFDLAVSVLGFIEKIAKGIESLINKIPGVEVDLTSKITNLKDSFAEDSAKIKSEASLKEYLKPMDGMDYSEAVTKGSNMGLSAYNNVNDALNSVTNPAGMDPSKFDLGTPKNPVVTEGTGTDGSVKVNMEDEDLSYLRDMAERDYIANIATNTLAPNISVSFGDVHETADINELFGRIRTILKEQIATAPEGVY